jgi:hypothetical protein
LPELVFTVASPFFHDQEAKAGNVNRIRAGEVAATAIVLGTGWAVSGGALGRFPIYASIAISAVFIAGYEFQIAHPSKNEATPAQAQATPAAMGSWNNPG